MKQAGFFDVSKRHAKLLKRRDFLERVNQFVGWEAFRPVLDTALARKPRDKGGRPPFDAVLMFKVLVLQALYNRNRCERPTSRRGLFAEHWRLEFGRGDIVDNDGPNARHQHSPKDAEYRRVEVITGRSGGGIGRRRRRRRFSPQAMAPGATVTEVARRL